LALHAGRTAEQSQQEEHEAFIEHAFFAGHSDFDEVHPTTATVMATVAITQKIDFFTIFFL
jgi:hypothetical protein